MSRLHNALGRLVYSGIKRGGSDILSGEMLKKTGLVELNLAWLRQALSLLGEMDDKIFSLSPELIAPQRVSAHLRHVIEFYECFLDGLQTRRIDYDARRRNPALEQSRHAAAKSIRSIIQRLHQISTDGPLSVRVEDSRPDVYMSSSVTRELQALSSHTIHHFALIAVVLKLHGFAVHPDFGMSPSTLTYLAAQKEKAA